MLRVLHRHYLIAGTAEQQIQREANICVVVCNQNPLVHRLYTL